MERGWARWMFLNLLVAGASQLTLQQPPMLTATLGHNVMMPCHISHQDEATTSPFLYWLKQNESTEVSILSPQSESYCGRVERIDNDQHSENLSILLKAVQWADRGKYLCKLSVLDPKTGRRYRVKGNTMSLLIRDNMTFNLTGLDDNLLRCTVNVTPDPGFVLSILHNGEKTQTVATAPGNHNADLPYVSLSETVPLTCDGKYECQLHLNKHLITKSTFDYFPGFGAAEKNFSCYDGQNATNSTASSETGEPLFPEPWLLYGALLLVPLIVLLGLIMALLVRRR